MKLNELTSYCLKKPGVSETYPFDAETLVFKVGSKMFLLTSPTNESFSINVKCDPSLSIALRNEYTSIAPGYHMNKVHWNTIVLNSDLSDEQAYWLIDLSYDLVFKGLTKLEKEKIKGSIVEK